MSGAYHANHARNVSLLRQKAKFTPHPGHLRCAHRSIRAPSDKMPPRRGHIHAMPFTMRCCGGRMGKNTSKLALSPSPSMYEYTSLNTSSLSRPYGSCIRCMTKDFFVVVA